MAGRLGRDLAVDGQIFKPIKNTAPGPYDPVLEAGRLSVLRWLDLVGTAREPVYDALTKAAAVSLDAPIAMFSLIEKDRYWFKAKVGLDLCEGPRDFALCSPRPEAGELFWLEDARDHPSLQENGLVVGEPFARFCAGAPVVVDGWSIGALCVIDTAPRPFCTRQAATLRALADSVAELVRARAHKLAAVRLLETTTDAAICCNSEGRITLWNQGAEQLLGYAAEEMDGRNIAEVFPPAFSAEYLNTLRLRAQSSQPITGAPTGAFLLRKDGAIVDVDMSFSLWLDGNTFGIGAILRDRSERNRQEEALAAAKQSAEAANIAKSEFLANMSHEIRTPLNGVIGMADLLARSPLSPKDREVVSIIRSSGDSLNRLLSDILDLAKIEAGQVTIEAAPFDLAEAVRSAAALSDLRAQEKGLTLTVEVAPALEGRFVGDEVRLRQIITNLVSNAVKFTAGGAVRVRAGAAASGSLRIEVEDTGIGFSAEQKAHLFSRFQQGDGSINRRYGGSGLGLAISKQLAELMGGALDCESRPAAGSLFWLELPLERAEPDRARAVADGTAEEDWNGCRVLIADDHPTNRTVVDLILKEFGFATFSVENGVEALEAIRRRPFDVVLMDMQMPVMDGLAATCAIRRREEAEGRPRLPILMLTANALPEHVAQGAAAGADGHVAKPVTPAALLQAIMSVLSRAETAAA
jgi:PAS domain S-box-containing protein